jgi:hypothetical protein
MEVEIPKLTGTPFVMLVTAFFYVGTGPTKLGGFRRASARRPGSAWRWASAPTAWHWSCDTSRSSTRWRRLACWGTAMTRPRITALGLASLLVAYALRRKA